jgi:imidazolonepropionase-like amidohydrolase
MGGEDWLDVHARQAIADGDLEGPRLSIATRGLAPSNGYGKGRAGFDGPDELRRAARENLSAGADFLKVFATGGVASGSGLDTSAFGLEEMKVVVEEAERKRTYVAAHAHGGPGLQIAAESGVRTIEHAAVATPADIEAMLKHNCWVVATYSILFRPDGIELGDAANPAILDKVRWARETVAMASRQIFESGLRVALGSDSMHGSMAFEIQTAVRFGMTPRQALLAATARAAEALRMQDRVGTLQPGRFAGRRPAPGPGGHRARPAGHEGRRGAARPGRTDRSEGALGEQEPVQALHLAGRQLRLGVGHGLGSGRDRQVLLVR